MSIRSDRRHPSIDLTEDDQFWAWMFVNGYGGLLGLKEHFIKSSNHRLLANPPELALVGYRQLWERETGRSEWATVTLLGKKMTICLIGEA